MKENTAENNHNIFEGLGQLVIEFERLILTLKVSIYTLLILDGLKEVRYARVMLAELTAYPMLQKFRSLLSIRYVGRDLELKHVDRLFVLTEGLISQRNFMVHGSWFNDRTESDPITAEIFKDKTFKRGVDEESHILSTAQMQDLTEKIRQADSLFTTLNLCIYEPGCDLRQKLASAKIERLKIQSDFNGNN
ncbi:hypothetical protein GCM10022246_24950 [Pedobacter ginsengiterrae]|uniref:HEPN AbiU2-like domain-containing protein n=1 Tax=Pedobacter ginsengiterrae TaxID=871696 RepID=A0ABP7PX24_9SPHI